MSEEDEKIENNSEAGESHNEVQEKENEKSGLNIEEDVNEEDEENKSETNKEINESDEDKATNVDDLNKVEDNENESEINNKKDKSKEEEEEENDIKEKDDDIQSSQNLYPSIPSYRPDPQEVEDALELLMNEKKIPPPHLRDSVIQLISSKRLDAIIDRNYDLAEKYDKAGDKLAKDESNARFEEIERKRKLNIEDREESVNSKIEQVKQKYDKKIEDANNEKSSAIKSIKEKHEWQNNEFRQRWQDPEFLSKYKHPSNELLELRMTEKRLALSKLYDEAKEKKLLADKIQRAEEKELQETIEEEMKKEFFKMKNDQNAELNKTEAYYDSILSSLELQKNKEIQTLDLAVKQIGKKKNTALNRKLYSIPKELLKINDNDSDSLCSSKTTPETAAKLAQFRNDKKVHLSINPIADNVFSKLIASHPIIPPISKYKIKPKNSTRHKNT